MSLTPVKEKGTLTPIESNNNDLGGKVVNVDDMGYESQTFLSTPEQRQRWAAQGPEGWWEYAQKTKGSDLYYGEVMGAGSLYGLVNRLRKDEYKDNKEKERDMQVLKDVMLRQEEMATRGSTWGKDVYKVVAQIPTFALEMGLTGGLASVVRKGFSKAASRGAKEVAKKSLIKKGLEVLGREAVVGAARTTVLPHRYLAGYAERNLNEHIAITDKGIQILEEAQEKPIVSFMKAYGDAFVEFYSEEMGGQLFKPLGRVAGKGILAKMPAATRKTFQKFARGVSKSIPKGRWTDLLTKGGWHGIAEEYGEERFGALLRTAFGLDERDISTMDKIQEAVFPGWYQASVEIGAFSIFGGMGTSAQIITNKLSSKGRSKEQIDKTLKNLSQTEKDRMAEMFLTKDFEEGIQRANLVIKASSGEALSQEEKDNLSGLYDNFIEEGLIEVEEEQEGEELSIIEKAQKIIEAPAAVEVKEEANPRAYPEKQREFTEQEKRIIQELQGDLASPDTGKLIKDAEGKVVGRIGSERVFDFLIFRKREAGEPKSEYQKEYDKSGLRTRQLSATFNNILEGKPLTNAQTRVAETILAAAKEHSVFKEEVNNVKKEFNLTEEELNKYLDEVAESLSEEEQINQQAVDELLEEEQVSEKKSEWQRADIEKKVKLLYQGREKQLDQRRIAIEKEMTLLEQKMAENKKQNKSVKAIQNKLNSLSKELESIHYQIADLEDTAIERLEREGILIGGKDLEQLRKKAFRQGEIALRKDLMAKIRAEKQEKLKREKATKKILKQPKKPENVIDVQYQKRINTILERIGKKKKEQRKTLNSMSTEELEALALEISELKTKGREVFKSKKEQQKMASEILRATLLKSIGGLPDGTFAKGSVSERKAKKTSARRRVTLANIRPLRFIREVFGKIGERLIYDPIDHAWTQKIAHDISRQGKIRESMKKNNISMQDYGKVIEINGREFQIDQILSMYIFQKDAHAYQMVQQGNNLTESEINGFIDIVRKEYPSYLKFADDVQRIVAERFEELNWIMETFYNVPMEKVKVYFPLHLIAFNQNNPDLYGDIESYHIYEQVLRKGEGFNYSSAYKNMTISRKEIGENFSSEVDLRFLNNAYNAISNQEHLISFAHLQKAFNKFINDSDIRDAVKYNYSDKAWRDFNDYLNININPHLMINGADFRWVRKIREGLARAYLGFNAVTALKQFPSVLAALKYTSLPRIANSVRKIMFSKKARENVYNLDPSLKNRIITRDFNEIMAVIRNLPEGDIKRSLIIASKKIDKVAFSWITQIDKIAVLSVYDSVYEHQRLTKSETEARDIAHKAFIETQPQGGIKDLPSLYRTNNEFARMVVMFTNQLNQYWNMATSDLPMEIRNKEYGKAMTGIASMAVISTVIYIASHGRLPEEPEEWIEAIFGTTIGSIPILGNIGMSLMRGYTPSVSPADALLDNLKSAISNIQNDNYAEAFEKSLFIISVLLGLPYSQLRRTIKGGIELYDGTADDLRRLIWSESMLEPR